MSTTREKKRCRGMCSVNSRDALLWVSHVSTKYGYVFLSTLSEFQNWKCIPQDLCGPIVDSEEFSDKEMSESFNRQNSNRT